MIGAILAGVYGDVAPLGDFESIATSIVGAGGASSVTFSSIPTSFQHLQLRIIGRSNFAATSENIYVTFNNVTTGSLYAQHQLVGDGSSASASASINQDRIFPSLVTGSTAGSNTFGASVIDILDYANTNKFKTTRTLTGNDNNGNGFMVMRSGLFRSTDAITRIDLSPGATYSFAQHTHIALYGIKG
jgi:hypothetical protein